MTLPSRIQQEAPFSLSVLGVILLAAFSLRFHELGIPEILHDEGLVLNAAKQSWSYIALRSWMTDAHPPYFYYLMKAVLIVDSSKIGMRLPSAIAGTAAVFLLYRTGMRLISRKVGLIAAALLSTHLIAIELSRVVRPHALIMVLGLLSFLKMLDYLEKPCRRTLSALVLVNLLLLTAHFNAVLIIGAEVVIIGWRAYMLRGPLVRSGVLFLALTACTIGVNALFLLARLNNFPGVGTNESYLWTAQRTVENLAKLLTLYPLPGGETLGILLLFAGVWSLRQKPSALGLLLCMALLPLCALILMRYGIIYHEVHIAFILPFLLLFCAAALENLLPGMKRGGLLLVALGTALIILCAREILYTPDASLIGGGGSFRQETIARQLPAPGRHPIVTVMNPNWLRPFVDWHYTPRTHASLSDIRISPSDEAFEFISIWLEAEGTGSFAARREEHDAPDTQGPSPLHRRTLPRTAATEVSSLPASLVLPAAPESFYASVFSAHGLVPVQSPLGPYLPPSAHGSEGEFTYRIVNKSAEPSPEVRIGLNISALHGEDTIEVFYRMDGKPFQSAILLNNQEKDGTITLLIHAGESFSTLDIRVAIRSSSRSASFYNLPSSPAFNGMTVRLDPRDESFDFGVPAVTGQIDEPESAEGRRFRWGNGPESLIVFNCDRPQSVILDVEVRSPIKDQTVGVVFNDQTAGVLRLPAPGKPVQARIALPAGSGANVARLRYAYWNHGDHQESAETFAPHDSRPLAAAFTRLRLSPEVKGERVFAYFEEYK